MRADVLPIPEPRTVAPAVENNPDKVDLREQAEDFIRDNPEVFELFLHFARQALDCGARRIGAKAIAERVRWEVSLSDRSGWKVNNNLVAYIARAMVAADPRLASVLSFRRVHW